MVWPSSDGGSGMCLRILETETRQVNERRCRPILAANRVHPARKAVQCPRRRRSMLTATKDLVLASTTTGSFPRPRWFDVCMWGRPLDTCMQDVRFREKFQDALTVVVGDQERAGLDVLSHGDFHVDEDLAGR